MEAAATHPPAADLAAYGLGKLDAARRDIVERHLAACAACRQAVEDAPPDSLLALLQGGAPAAATAQPGPADPTHRPAGALVDTRSDEEASPPGTVSHPGAGSPLVGSDVPPGLTHHPHYRVVRLLGKGGMGAVFLAEQTVMKRPVAVKVVSAAIAGNPKARARFLKEIVTAAKLDHHNIVRALHAEESGDTCFLVMEYVEGVDLNKYVARKGPLPVALACHFVRQAALGLQHAHEHGLVHRDLKPHNLMLTPRGVVKVLDFGLAKVASEVGEDGGQTQAGAMMGTPDYVAPEQTQDARSADIRADIYSLGCTLYHLLAGEPPFAGGSVVHKVARHLQGQARPLHEARRDVPAELSALVARMMTKDPAQRPQSPREVADALLPFVKAKGEPAGSAPPAPPRRGRRRLALAAGLLGAAVLAAALVVSVKTRAGTLVLELDPPDAEVIVDGEVVKVTRSDRKTAEVRVKPGTRVIEVRKDGFRAEAPRTITLAGGGTETLKITLEPMPDTGALAVQRGGPPAEVVSTFDTSTEDWQVGVRDLQGPVTHHPVKGNAGGYVSAKQRAPEGAVLPLYWQAPEKFLGDKSAFYGGSLSFETRQDLSDDEEGFNAPDVMLRGGGLILFCRLGSPGAGWRRFDVRLHEDAGWTKGPRGPKPTADEMKQVLAGLNLLGIRAQYRRSDDASYLDNVRLSPP